MIPMRAVKIASAMTRGFAPHRLTLPGRAGRTISQYKRRRDRKKKLRFTTVWTRTSTKFAQEHRRDLTAHTAAASDPACIFPAFAGCPIPQAAGAAILKIARRSLAEIGTGGSTDSTFFPQCI
jgi:hypothetical protein